MSEEAAAQTPFRWRETWPDALAFAAGLGMAWVFRWQTTDLVWSLWLSSLLVGYAMIVWSIFRPAVYLGVKTWGGRVDGSGPTAGKMALGGAAYLIGGLLMLAFFTVHFGGFHFVHSVFLNVFFPVAAGAAKSFPGPALYAEVFQRYWIFVPVAALAERGAFRFAPVPAGPPDPPVQTAAARGGDGMMAPYKNVVRMHLLIFFFAFAHFAKLEDFRVYAVVYAVYFFPWRVLKKSPAAPWPAA